MTFAWPQLLWLLVLPAGFLFGELTHRRRQIAEARPKILRAEAGARSLRFSEGKPDGTNGRGPRVWLALGLSLALLALARPQWGRIEEPVFDQSREILLAVDLSRSMLTPDVKPSRLDRSKLLIQSLLERLAGERVGLIVFSGTSFLQSPLSADYEILREFLPALGPDFLPEGGTNYRAMLDAALEAFTPSASADRFLIVLSDGEATEETWRPRAAELKRRNIRVIGLGVGTEGGAIIPDGSGGFVKDERGAVVLSRLESGTLQELANTTGGAYRDASTWVDLAALLKETVEAGQAGKFVETRTVRFVERFQWPLALGLWCLLVSVYFEFPVRPRTRDLRIAAHGATEKEERRNEQGSVASPAVALLLGLLLAPFVPGLAPAQAATSAAAPEPELSPLGRMVGRLAASPVRTARDWAEFARETVTWGTGLQSQQQSVPEGPVRDALAAVELGSQSNASTANWPKLREELEALLRKPEEDPQQEEQNPQQQDRQQQQQNQDQQKQEQQQKQQDRQNDQKSEPQQSSQDQKDQQQQQQQGQPQQPEQQPPGESAFGDMSEKQEPPPPPPGDTRKVGGTPEQKEQPNEPVDPSLALPLQKLEQLRNQDSPAHLFQLMEGERKQDRKPAKDW